MGLSLVHLLPFCFFFPASSAVTHLCWTCAGSNPRIVNCRANRGLRKVQSPSRIETDILNLVDCNHNKAHLLYDFISFNSYCFLYNWLRSISSWYAVVKPSHWQENQTAKSGKSVHAQASRHFCEMFWKVIFCWMYKPVLTVCPLNDIIGQCWISFWTLSDVRHSACTPGVKENRNYMKGKQQNLIKLSWNMLSHRCWSAMCCVIGQNISSMTLTSSLCQCGWTRPAQGQAVWVLLHFRFFSLCVTITAFIRCWFGYDKASLMLTCAREPRCGDDSKLYRCPL